MQTSVSWKKALAVVVGTSAAVGTAQYVQTDAVDIVQLVVSVLTAVLAFLTDKRK